MTVSKTLFGSTFRIPETSERPWGPDVTAGLTDLVIGFEGVYNVKAAAYGAKGDGTTDDTAAIQSALNAAASAGGGIVFFPSGTYLVLTSTTLTMNISPGTIVVGTGASTLKVSANAGDVSKEIGRAHV